MPYPPSFYSLFLFFSARNLSSLIPILSTMAASPVLGKLTLVLFPSFPFSQHHSRNIYLRRIFSFLRGLLIVRREVIACDHAEWTTLVNRNKRGTGNLLFVNAGKRFTSQELSRQGFPVLPNPETSSASPPPVPLASHEERKAPSVPRTCDQRSVLVGCGTSQNQPTFKPEVYT